MISDGEILSFIEDKIIVKDENEKIVFSHYLSYNSLFTT